MAVDATVSVLREQIAAAKDALVRAASDAEEEWPHAYELKLKARNGWGAGVMSLALNRLVEEGTFEAHKGRVRLRP